MDGRCSQPGAPRAGGASRSEAGRASQRFSRSHRLNRKAEFDRVLGQRTIRVASGPFVAFACAAAANGPRLGLVVGKRFAPRAVDRNRIRRVVRESFRRRRADLPALDIVVQCVRVAGSEAPATAIERLWDGLSRKHAGRSP